MVRCNKNLISLGRGDAAKLETACIYGKLLCELAADVEKLVQFTGLPYGDAVMLVEEVTSLLRGSTWHQFVECGNGNDSPVPGDSPDTGYEYQSSNNQVAVSVPVPEKAPSEGSNGAVL